MSGASTKILLLEHSDIDAELIAVQLRRLASEVTITRASSRDNFIAAAEHGRFDIVLADYSLPDLDSLAALTILREKRPDAPFIFVSGVLGEEFAIEALKRGATDYILKRSLVRLPSAIERALVEAHERAERHRADAALLRSEVRLQRLNELLRREVKARTRERDRIWDISPNLLAVVRASDGIPILVNQAWTRLLGWSEADMLTTTIRDLVHPGDRSLADGVREDQSVMFENRIRNATGAYRWFSWNVVPDEGLLYAVGHDVTEKRLAAEELAATNRALKRQIDERAKVEQTLRQMQRLEAVGQLTSGVAHDFNNLLTVILGNLTFLEREPSQSPTDKRRLAHMRAAAERGAQLTAQLLAFSRRQRLEPKPINLNETVEGMSDLLRSTMGGSPDRIDYTESRDQCARCDACGRQSYDPNIERHPGRDKTPGGTRPRRLRHAIRQRYRLWHGRTCNGPRFRAILHHKTGGQGIWSGACSGVRFRQAVRRWCQHRHQAERRHRGQRVSSARSDSLADRVR